MSVRVCQMYTSFMLDILQLAWKILVDLSSGTKYQLFVYNYDSNDILVETMNS